MPPIDNPLKILILSFSRAFVEWLLGQPVQHVHPLNAELPATTLRSDLVFEVLQADGQPVLLHIELQGRRTAEPMSWRMLDYLSRLARRELGKQPPEGKVKLHSVVIYTGVGAGIDDTGQYEIPGLKGISSLSWRYEPVRLWQMEAEELLALGQPAFLALVGQARMTEPERILPAVIAELRQVADEEQRGRLLTALTSLMTNKEALEMVEKLIDVNDELLDTPYLRRIREQGRVEGLIEGKEEGLLAGLREAILETVTLRFDPAASIYRRVNHQLEQLTSREQLQQLLVVAVQAEDMSTFTAHLAEVAPSE